MFFTIKIDQWMLNLVATQRQIGLEMQLGPLARIMGPNEDLAEKVSDSKELMICVSCSCKPVVIAALAENS
jgi:hypothetical protein